MAVTLTARDRARLKALAHALEPVVQIGTAGLTEADGRPIRLKKALIVDALATLGAGIAGTSSGTAFVESIAGIRMGGRSGRAAVVTNEKTHTKKIIFHPKMLPAVTICDPELTVGMPPHITAGTGMDAFSHALEALCVPSYHALADGIASTA